MKKSQQIQNLYKLYKQETGNQIVDLHKFSKWLEAKGWTMPVPPNPLDLLAKQVAEALREQTRKDSTTGLPYKVNFSFTVDGTGQGVYWADVDEAPRKIMLKGLVQRREQMIGDAYQLTLIQDHWNSINPHEEPIQLPLDFQPDVDWRKNGGDEAMAAA